MLSSINLNVPGEHRLIFSGVAGPLEAVLDVPERVNEDYLAILGHPHSLQGGTMNNKVVTTLARTFRTLNIPSLRFNFRGVGQSQGVYDAGIGESDDMLVLVHEWLQHRPQTQIFFAGFSFGSYVAYRAAAQHPHRMLITIAPPIHHFNYTEFLTPPCPWWVVQGDEDEVVPAQIVYDFAAQVTPSLPLIRFPDTGHFFHGKLIDLKTRLIDAIREQAPK